jgi:pyruvate dehydrogenase (quinone)
MLNAPVAFTFRGKDILEAANPNAAGMTGLLGWGGAHVAIAECDLLLMLGTDFPYHPFMPEKSTIVQIDEQAGHLGRRAKVDIGLVGDVGETLKALLPRLQQRSGRDFLDKILAVHKKAAEISKLM